MKGNSLRTGLRVFFIGLWTFLVILFSILEERPVFLSVLYSNLGAIELSKGFLTNKQDPLHIILARHHFETALKWNINNLGAIRNLSLTCSDEYCPYTRLAVLLAAVSRNPSNPRLRFELAQAYFELGRFRDARPYFLESAESASFLLWQASKYIKDGQTNSAIETYEFLLSIKPQNIRALYSLAQQLLNNARLSDAIAVLERARLINSNDSRFWRLRGRAYMQLGKGDLAIADFENAVKHSESDDDVADAHHMLGISLLQFHHDYSQAITELQIASSLRTNPVDKYYDYVEMGSAALERGYTEDAIHWLQEANLANPDISGADYLLGKAYIQSGQPSLASYWLKQAIALESNIPDYHRWLAEAYLQIGSVREVVSELQTAAQMQPSTALYHLKLGKALEIQGNNTEALLQFQIALELDPASLEAQQGIERLTQHNQKP